MSPETPPVRLSGRVTPAGEGLAWPRFLFTPEGSFEAPFEFVLPAGVPAFLLHGVLSQQPELPICGVRFPGTDVVHIEATPHFAEEIVHGNAAGPEVPVRLTIKNAKRLHASAPASAKAKPSVPSLVNHHPVYCMEGRIIEPEAAFADASPVGTSPVRSASTGERGSLVSSRQDEPAVRQPISPPGAHFKR